MSELWKVQIEILASSEEAAKAVKEGLSVAISHWDTPGAISWTCRSWVVAGEPEQHGRNGVWAHCMLCKAKPGEECVKATGSTSEPELAEDEMLLSDGTVQEMSCEVPPWAEEWKER
jgi:hypothetical protein